jgi:hypothetical protein
VSSWIWLGVATTLLFVGIAVMAIGVFVIARQLMPKPLPRPQTPVPVPAVAARPATPRPSATPIPPSAGFLGADALIPSKSPKVEDEWVDEVPTAVFKPSDYKDIEGLMADADRYVDGHRRGS